MELGKGTPPLSARLYRPDLATRPGVKVVFLHGGYAVLGGLDLQDGYCRRIAAILGIEVLAIDYRLAPEHVLADSADDAVAAVVALRAQGPERLVLWGDSAGGAVALRASRAARPAVLVLTNPNVDLRLAEYDEAAPGGPDRELSGWAFAQWAGEGQLERAPDLAANVADLPPVFAAVGSDDSLLPDSRRLVERCRRANVPSELVVVPGASHGFMSAQDDPAVKDVITAAGDFLDAHS